MDSPINLKRQGKRIWEQDPRRNNRLLLIYTAVAVVLPLMVSLLGIYLDGQISHTSGLSGVGQRSALEFLSVLASVAVQVFLPFWEMGLLYTVIQIREDKEASTHSLWGGFRLWGVILRVKLYQAFRYTVEVLCGIFVATLLFMLTPLSDGLMNLIKEVEADPALSGATADVLVEAFAERLSIWDLLPYYILCALAIGGLLIPVIYRYRLANYIIFYEESPKALPALRESRNRMLGNAWQYFLLDLRFWWYYLLLAAVAVLPVALDFAPIWMALSTAVAQFLIFFLFRGPVETAYVQAFISLKEGDESLC